MAAKKKTTEPEPFTALEIAELASKFLPPLSLDEGWEKLTPFQLQRRLSEEFAPDGISNLDVEPTELEKEALKPSYVPPAVFDVLAQAAVQRAKVLLHAAENKTAPKWLDPRNAHRNKVQRQKAESVKNDRLRREFVKKFHNRETVTLDEAAKAVLGRVSPAVRAGLIDRWFEIAEEEGKTNLLYGGGVPAARYRANGVTIEDYAIFKEQLLLCKKRHHKAVQKAVRRKAGSKGGRHTQAKLRKTQGATPLGDPTNPAQKPNRTN